MDNLAAGILDSADNFADNSARRRRVPTIPMSIDAAHSAFMPGLKAIGEPLNSFLVSMSYEGWLRNPVV